jgi:hypothetical protein
MASESIEYFVDFNPQIKRVYIKEYEIIPNKGIELYAYYGTYISSMKIEGNLNKLKNYRVYISRLNHDIIDHYINSNEIELPKTVNGVKCLPISEFCGLNFYVSGENGLTAKLIVEFTEYKFNPLDNLKLNLILTTYSNTIYENRSNPLYFYPCHAIFKTVLVIDGDYSPSDLSAIKINGTNSKINILSSNSIEIENNERYFEISNLSEKMTEIKGSHFFRKILFYDGDIWDVSCCICKKILMNSSCDFNQFRLTTREIQKKRLLRLNQKIESQKIQRQREDECNEQERKDIMSMK